jgi:hypothetical protein
MAPRSVFGEYRMQKFNWERGFFRLWLFVSALLFGLGVIVSASVPNVLLPVVAGTLAFSAGLFALGYALRWVLRGFNRDN